MGLDFEGCIHSQQQSETPFHLPLAYVHIVLKGLLKSQSITRA